MKRHWRELQEGTPGRRFREHHERRREQSRPPWQRVAIVASGVVLIAIGIVMLVAPGPGVLFIAGGGALLAEESFLAARVLDWADVPVRRFVSWARVLWQRATSTMRLVLTVLFLLPTSLTFAGACALAN